MTKTAILIIHGFSSNFCDNEYLINYLEYNSNYDVFTFTLPGHGTPFMKKVKYQDWIDYSINEMEKLIKKYQKIHLIGHSMGGIIATYLSTIYPKYVDKLVLLAPGFIFGNLKQNKTDFINLFKKDKLYDTNGFEGFLTKLITIPKRRYIELNKLIKTYRIFVKDITSEVLIIHGDIDNIVPIKAIYEAFETITSKKHLTIVKGVRHKLLISSKKEIITDYIYTFLTNNKEFKKIEKNYL